MNHDWPGVLVEDERAFCQADARLQLEEITVERGGSVAAVLPLVTVGDPGSFSNEYRAHMRFADLTGPLCLIGGGLAIRRTAWWTRAGDAPALRAEAFSRAVELAVERGATPVILYADQGDLEAACAVGRAHSLTPQGGWASLSLSGETFDEFLAGMPRRPRQVWARDSRDASRLGLTFTDQPLDDATIAAVAPMISSVAERNGLRQPATLTKWLLRGLLSRPGECTAITTTANDELVGACIARRWGDVLDLHSVGVRDGTVDRRSLYHATTYLGPLHYALENSFTAISFGVEHLVPKERRGCSIADLSRVVFR